jgi:hypothetical protein
MVYTAMGSIIKVVKGAGDGFAVVEFDDGEQATRPIAELKADGGIQEILSQLTEAA